MIIKFSPGGYFDVCSKLHKTCRGYLSALHPQKHFIVLSFLLLLLNHRSTDAQITLLHDYQNNYSAAIGTFQGINFREAGFSGLCNVVGSNGKEFWTVSDRGVNVDAANANPAGCTPTYDKIYGFPAYSPKIHRIRIDGDSVQILQTITLKRPDGSGTSGLLNPTGFGSTATEVVSTDTVLDCANFNSKVAGKDIWGIDSEGILVDKDGNFWICEEGGPTVWKVNPNGVIIKRYTPYANLPGAEVQDVAIDSVFKYRKNNRGFEGISITPNGKIYAIIQSPVLYPDKSTGEGTRVHRILEINPTDNSTRMFAYLNDGVIGSGGPDQIRLRDWKISDMSAINDSTFLVIEAAARGVTDTKKIYVININGATPVNSGLYAGSTLEGLLDSAGLAASGIVPVKKTLFMDMLANGWPALLDKAEGISIINDSTIAICNDNDYGQVSPTENGVATATGKTSHVIVYGLQGSNKISNYQPLIGSPLPLQLNSFTAKLNNGKSYLQWKSENELNVQYYEIERSSDGHQFIRIANVNGTGATVYNTIDERPLKGNNYYRLKIVDKDGKFRYSIILLINVSNHNNFEFVIYPNPVKNILIIAPSGITDPVSVTLINQQGQKVLAKQISGTTGIPVGHLPKGIYMVQLISKSVSKVEKLVKE